MRCRECSRHIGQYVDGTLGESARRRVEEHLHVCRPCASLAREFESCALMVRSLRRVQARPGFQEKVRSRLAAGTIRDTRDRAHSVSPFRQSPLHGLASILRPALRPAAVVLLLCAFVAVSLLVAGTPGDVAASTDWGYINACREQHESYVAADPLADQSAADLAGQMRELNGSL